VGVALLILSVALAPTAGAPPPWPGQSQFVNSTSCAGGTVRPSEAVCVGGPIDTPSTWPCIWLFVKFTEVEGIVPFQFFVAPWSGITINSTGEVTSITSFYSVWSAGTSGQSEVKIPAGAGGYKTVVITTSAGTDFAETQTWTTESCA
jgi:hypothetical protein